MGCKMGAEMGYELTKTMKKSETVDHEDDLVQQEAVSFREFARAVLLGLGALLAASATVYILFSAAATVLMRILV